jgi:hypothetical protein
LAEIGFANAVLARETPHRLMLLDGHLRAEVAASEIIPVLVLDVNEVESDLIPASFDPGNQRGRSGRDSLFRFARTTAAHPLPLRELLNRFFHT